jgi:hypothetical protein
MVAKERQFKDGVGHSPVVAVPAADPQGGLAHGPGIVQVPFRAQHVAQVRQASDEQDASHGLMLPAFPASQAVRGRRCSSQIVVPSATAVSATKMPASMDWKVQNRSAGWYR